jgi:hypothetical protein
MAMRRGAGTKDYRKFISRALERIDVLSHQGVAGVRKITPALI